MDFMKVFDQTVREIKREVNLKVLKVPEIEQKVLDATDNEPWGPHGTVLAEIAQATKKFTECQMVMNVLWARLGETGKDWRYVYKALAVIEYLVSNGSERAVDDIIEHTYQISSLTSFEYVEPSGKDNGINVRKKAETIVALLNNKDKIQEVRTKAAANRDKYVGLSSTGMTSKAASRSYSSGGFQTSDRYGGFSGTKDSTRYKDSQDEERSKDTYVKSRRGAKSDDFGNNSKMSSARYGSKGQDNLSSNASKSAAKVYDSTKSYSVSSKSSGAPLPSSDDDFDDFDPRGTSKKESATGNPNQVDLFGQSLIGDLLDAPTSGPTETSTMNNNSSEADMFADADFVSAPPQAETGGSFHTQKEVDLFASQPSMPSSSVDLFASPDPVVQSEVKPPKSSNISTSVDPFAAVPMNSFGGSDIFGAFTSNSDPVFTEPAQSTVNGVSTNSLKGISSLDSKSSQKDSFQVKSGIWADSLSRGLIDLNITAPKKVSMADVGVVGGLSELDEKVTPASHSMGRAMGAGTGLGRSGFTPPQQSAISDDDFFSSLSGQQYQFGGFNK